MPGCSSAYQFEDNQVFIQNLENRSRGSQEYGDVDMGELFRECFECMHSGYYRDVPESIRNYFAHIMESLKHADDISHEIYVAQGEIIMNSCNSYSSERVENPKPMHGYRTDSGLFLVEPTVYSSNELIPISISIKISRFSPPNIMQ
jgi:hypothetical protein